MLGNLHPCESTKTSVFSWEVGLFPALVEFKILFVWVDGGSFNHFLIYIFFMILIINFFVYDFLIDFMMTSNK